MLHMLHMYDSDPWHCKSIWNGSHQAEDGEQNEGEIISQSINSIYLLFHQATPYSIKNKNLDFSYERTSKVWEILSNLNNWNLSLIKTDFLQPCLNRCTISASEETTWSTSSQRDLNAPWALKCMPQENLMSQRTIRSTHFLIVHVSNFLSKELSKYCNTWIDVTFR